MSTWGSLLIECDFSKGQEKMFSILFFISVLFLFFYSSEKSIIFILEFENWFPPIYHSHYLSFYLFFSSALLENISSMHSNHWSNFYSVSIFPNHHVDI